MECRDPPRRKGRHRVFAARGRPVHRFRRAVLMPLAISLSASLRRGFDPSEVGGAPEDAQGPPASRESERTHPAVKARKEAE